MTDEAPTWRKSTYSNGTGGDCVEVGHLGRGTLVRDTKDRTRPRSPPPPPPGPPSSPA